MLFQHVLPISYSQMFFLLKVHILSLQNTSIFNSQVNSDTNSNTGTNGDSDIHSIEIATTENIVVPSPRTGSITNEISNLLVDRFSAENDPDMYFEFFPDGSFEISINSVDGYSKYTWMM